jgi:hypothetical protein
VKDKNKAALEALDRYVEIASTGALCANPPLNSVHCDTIRAALTSPAAQPERVTVEKVFRDITSYGGEKIDWSTPMARMIKAIPFQYPNGLIITEDK